MTNILRSVFAVCLLALLALLPISVSAQGVDFSGRANDFEFLKLIPNARTAALGSTGVALAQDYGAPFSNPAAIYTLFEDSVNKSAKFVSLGFAKHVLDINEGYATYSSEADMIGLPGAFAASLQYQDNGSFTEYTIDAVELGTFHAQDLALTLSYSGKESHGVGLGASVKFISSSLVSGSAVKDYSASGIAGDVGVFYALESQAMTFGVSAMNFGTHLSTYDGLAGPMPFNLQIGLSKKLERLPLMVLLAFRNLTRDREGRNLFYALNDFAVGGEFTLGKTVRLRFGYENQKRRDAKVSSGSGFSGFSLGTGIYLPKYQFDYAFNSQGGALSPLHKLSAAIRF